jgi:hypothetical protein
MAIAQFDAYGQQAKAAFEQAKAAAIDQGMSIEDANRAAYAAAGPLIQTIIDAAAQYGITLDANTQSLVDQAAASGIAFSTDKTDRLVMSIDALTKALGGVPPAVNAITHAVNDIPRDVQINVHTHEAPPTGNGDPIEPEPNPQSGGSGGLRNWGNGTLATLHGREAVLTEPEFNSLTRAAQRGTSGVSLTFGDITVNANDAQGGRDAAEAFIAAIKNNTAGLRTFLRLGNL